MYYPEGTRVRELTYEENIDLIAINDPTFLHRTKTHKNPIILYEPENINISLHNSNARFYYWYLIPYRLEDKEFKEFVLDYDLEGQIVSRTNVYEYFNSEYLNIRRISY